MTSMRNYFLFLVLLVFCNGSKDHCSLCAKDNCRIVSGLFTRPKLPVGYNLITQLPEQACNLTISQLKKNNNYLALRRSNGSFILNGEWKIRWSGDVEVAGMKFLYTRGDDNTIETIYSAGPLLETIDLMLIYQETNPGVKYQYQFPVFRSEALSNILTLSGKHLADDKLEINEIEMQRPSDQFFPFVMKNKTVDISDEVTLKAKHKVRRRKVSWKVVGFTECSKPCAGGIKTAVILCMREYNQMPVPEIRCAVHHKPLVPTLQCNMEPCAAHWVVEEWSECSVTCGEGLQIQSTSCKQEVSSDQIITVAAESCSSPAPPLKVTRSCHQPQCPEHKPLQVEWQIGPWSMCSVTCGMGIMSRTVHCPQNNCQNEYLPTESVCDMGSCTSTSVQGHGIPHSWLFTEWSQQCSESCGNGVQIRKVKCLGSEHQCDESLKPDSSRDCYSDKQCGGQWYSGPWGLCSVKCGWGEQHRSVICITKLSGNVAITSENNCLSKEKPVLQQQCYSDEKCDSTVEWYFTEWSQCTGDCENGVQIREVQCLNDDLIITNNCIEDKKPIRQRSCLPSHCSQTILDNSIAGSHSENVEFFSSHSNNDNILIGSQHGINKIQPVHNNVTPKVTTNNVVVQNLGEKEDCEDKFHNCNLVVQARLCKYKYYNTSCCQSCKH